MIVSQILRTKGSGAVETISGAATLQQAAATLSAKRIGALVVSANGETVEGIISERDIIGMLGRAGPDCLTGKVADLMTASVTTCVPADSAVSVLERMTAGRFRHMPVVEGGCLSGLISIGDVVKARMDEMAHENEALSEMIAGH